MGLIVSSNGGVDFKPCPAGTFIARLFQIIDLGTIEKTFQGKDPKKRHEVRLNFELLDDETKRDDGMPIVKGQTYTASLDKKANLTKDLEAIRGKAFTDEELKGFHLEKAIGVYCQITITHNQGQDGKVWANISAFSPLHKSMAKPSPVNENFIFDLDNPDNFYELPEWAQKRVAESDEWKSLPDIKSVPAETASPAAQFEDDVPF